MPPICPAERENVTILCCSPMNNPFSKDRNGGKTTKSARIIENPKDPLSAEIEAREPPEMSDLCEYPEDPSHNRLHHTVLFHQLATPTRPLLPSSSLPFPGNQRVPDH